MYDELLAAISADLRDLAVLGYMRGAVDLSAATGQHFNSASLPHYFTGDLSAGIVLVHLNPRQLDFSPEARWEDPTPSLEQYIDEFSHFGRRMYGPSSPRSHKSPFDHKQVRFLRPFGVVDFVPDDAPDSKYRNLELMCDAKLQLEIVPYGSRTFRVYGKSVNALAGHSARLLNVIAAQERSYVVFCGTVFDRLLSPYVARRHEFRLPKGDGSLTKDRYNFANVVLPHPNGDLRAGVASSFAQQGIPMAAYAAECAARY